jgi:hypothetical protein
LLKLREERRKVLIRARMRRGGVWSDVCIVNIASRGLGLQAANPPERGDYVEICRGVHVVIGRVVWSSERRFGVQTQGTIPIMSIVNEPDCSAAPSPQQAELRERRVAVRGDWQAERNRQRSRAMEFAMIAVGAVCVAASLGAVARDALATPLDIVGATLGNS